MQDRIRLKLNPANVAVPGNSRDLYIDANGDLVKESPGGTKETVGAITPEGINEALDGGTLGPAIIALADVSALTPPLGSLGRDTAGNPVVGDGATLGGVSIGTPQTTRMVGTVLLTEEQMDAAAIVSLGLIPVSTVNAAAGKKLRMRGRVWVVTLGAAGGTMRFGVRPTGLAAPTSSAQISGIPNLSTVDANKPVSYNVDLLSEWVDSSGELLLSAVATNTPDGAAFYTSSAAVISSAPVGSYSALNKITPAIATTLTAYFGTAANASATGAKFVYDLEFSWE